MAKRSKHGPAQDNPSGARVVNIVPVDGQQQDYEESYDDALAPARATHNPDRDFEDDGFIAQEVQEEQPPTQEPVAEGATEQVDDTPEWQKDHRFQGDPNKVYGSYRELEKKLHDISAENSEYRAFTSKFIQNQVLQQPPQQQPETPGEPSPQDVELLNEMLGQPSKFIEKIEQRFLGNLQQKAKINEVARVRHENIDTYQSPEFQGWVRENVPFALAQEADRDPQALRYVLNGYKAMTGQVPQQQQTQQVRQSTQEELAQKARIVQSAAGVPTASRASGEKVWTTREIMRLMDKDPHTYSKMSRPGGAIYEAYASGRVKD